MAPLAGSLQMFRLASRRLQQFSVQPRFLCFEEYTMRVGARPTSRLGPVIILCLRLKFFTLDVWPSHICSLLETIWSGLMSQSTIYPNLIIILSKPGLARTFSSIEFGCSCCAALGLTTKREVLQGRGTHQGSGVPTLQGDNPSGQRAPSPGAPWQSNFDETLKRQCGVRCLN